MYYRNTGHGTALEAGESLMFHREMPQLLSESFWMTEEFSLIRTIKYIKELSSRDCSTLRNERQGKCFGFFRHHWKAGSLEV